MSPVRRSKEARIWEDVHIKEFDMWSYTEAENTWLAMSRETASASVRDDAPDSAS